MIKNRLPWINMGIMLITVLVLVLGLAQFFFNFDNGEFQEDFHSVSTLPKNAFERDKGDYESIGVPLVLKFQEASIKLPNLERQLFLLWKE